MMRMGRREVRLCAEISTDAAQGPRLAKKARNGAPTSIFMLDFVPGQFLKLFDLVGLRIGVGAENQV
jgi:hypothetical protein